MLRAFRLALTYMVHPPAPPPPLFHQPLSLSHRPFLCPSQFTEDWMRSDPGSTMFLSLPGMGSPNKLGSPQFWSGVITHTQTHTCADG